MPRTAKFAQLVPSVMALEVAMGVEFELLKMRTRLQELKRLVASLNCSARGGGLHVEYVLNQTTAARSAKENRPWPWRLRFIVMMPSVSAK